MEDFTPRDRQDEPAAGAAYRPPTVTRLGDLADLTQKSLGGSDGTTFLGLDVIS